MQFMCVYGGQRMLARASGKCPEKGSLVVVTLDYLREEPPAKGYSALDGILYFISGKKRKCRLAVAPTTSLPLWMKAVCSNQ